MESSHDFDCHNDSVAPTVFVSKTLLYFFLIGNVYDEGLVGQIGDNQRSVHQRSFSLQGTHTSSGIEDEQGKKKNLIVLHGPAAPAFPSSIPFRMVE